MDNYFAGYVNVSLQENVLLIGNYFIARRLNIIILSSSFIYLILI